LELILFLPLSTIQLGVNTPDQKRRTGVSAPDELSSRNFFSFLLAGNCIQKNLPKDGGDSVHRIVAILLAIAFLVTAAAAQIPTKGNIFFGYSYVSADVNSGGRANLNGWNWSLEGKVLPFVGIVADISGHYGSENFPASCSGVPCRISANSGTHTVVFGPRLSAPVLKFTPFAEALFGVSHISGSTSGYSNSNTSFAEVLGGGIDYRLIHGIGFRLEGDLLQTRFFSNTQNDFRLSTGLVLHF
jgi:hypothetical protein